MTTSSAPQHLPEIISTFKSKGHYFCVVCCEREGKLQYFRFGVSLAGHLSLEKILQFRSFDAMPGLKYRYFATGNSSKEEINIKVELDRQVKNFNFPAPIDLIANLKWLVQEQDKAGYLSISSEEAGKREISWFKLTGHRFNNIFH